MPNLRNSLIDVEDCLLIVIDIQEHFLNKLPPERAGLMRNRACWLVEIARILHVPVVMTAEDADHLKGLAEPLAGKLPPRTIVFNKMSYNLAAQPDILRAVRATGRRTAVLVGLETDVCVAQSAIGLLEEDYDVVVVADATDAPGEGHALGLKRMENAGVLITSLKSLYYEWVRTVERSTAIERDYLPDIGKPKDIIM